eukprot:scaffold97_cov261-Pinguiococcus_pyrenoidosus.AAC.30
MRGGPQRRDLSWRFAIGGWHAGEDRGVHAREAGERGRFRALQAQESHERQRCREDLESRRKGAESEPLLVGGRGALVLIAELSRG